MDIHGVILRRMQQLGVSTYRVAHDPRVTCCPSTIHKFCARGTGLHFRNLSQICTVLGLSLRPVEGRVPLGPLGPLGAKRA